MSSFFFHTQSCGDGSGKVRLCSYRSSDSRLYRYFHLSVNKSTSALGNVCIVQCFGFILFNTCLFNYNNKRIRGLGFSILQNAVIIEDTDNSNALTENTFIKERNGLNDVLCPFHLVIQYFFSAPNPWWILKKTPTVAHWEWGEMKGAHRAAARHRYSHNSFDLFEKIPHGLALIAGRWFHRLNTILERQSDNHLV